MWYLFAFVDKLESFRTFGLDRIRNLVITDDVFQREPALEETAKRFDDVYGLVYEPDNNPTAPIEEVKLRVSSSMLPYLRSLPIHRSQVIEEDVITLHLIIYPELKNRIMSYGEHIEVLSPVSLRESIKDRIQKMLSNYK